MLPVVPALWCLLLALPAPATAQELADRRLYIEEFSGLEAAGWAMEVLKAAVGEAGGALLVDASADADATLSLAFTAEAGGKWSVEARLREPGPAGEADGGFIQGYELSSLSSELLVAELARPLAARLAAALPPRPQRVTRIETTKTVEDVAIVEKTRGALVGLHGDPGARLRFSDGREAVLGADGYLSLGEVPQNSSIVVTISEPGHHDTRQVFVVGGSDVEFELRPEPFERWGSVLSWTISSVVPTRGELNWGIFPRHLELAAGLMFSFGYKDMSGTDFPTFLQPDVGLAYQALPESWPLRLWAGGRILSRFDYAGAFGWSSRLRLGIELPLALELWLTRNIALRIEYFALLFLGELFPYSFIDANQVVVKVGHAIDAEGGGRTLDVMQLAPGLGLCLYNDPLISLRVAF